MHAHPQNNRQVPGKDGRSFSKAKLEKGHMLLVCHTSISFGRLLLHTYNILTMPSIFTMVL
jgi:hypothetical protein